jgi:hypothetical protein
LPLAPCRVKARRHATGITITWLRRARFGGDSWELAEVPLAEESEAYLVDVMAGALRKRQFSTSQPTVTYPAADEIADFGMPQSVLTLRIRQISRAVGPGAVTEVLVSVT